MPLTVIDLGQKVKAKYPQYADMDDAELGRRVKAKYPQYSDFMDAPQGSTAPKVDIQPAPASGAQQFWDALKNNSILNPSVAKNAISSAFSSPFSDSNMAEAQHQANVMSGKEKPAPMPNLPSTAGEIAGLGTNAAVLGGLGKLASIPAVGEAAESTGAAIKGGAKGAVRAAVEAATSPKSASQAVGSALVAHLFGMSPEADAAIGAATTVPKIAAGAIKGGKAALADLKTARLVEASRANPRLPAWMAQSSASPEPEPVAPAAPTPTPQLPSGRQVGPAPQAPPAPPAPPRVPLWQQLQAKMGFPVPSEPQAAPQIAPATSLPSGRTVGGIANQAHEAPPPPISMINGKAFLRNEKGQFLKAAEMPAPAGVKDRVVIQNGKPYININGHLFDPKALQK